MEARERGFEAGWWIGERWCRRRLQMAGAAIADPIPKMPGIGLTGS